MHHCDCLRTEARIPPLELSNMPFLAQNQMTSIRHAHVIPCESLTQHQQLCASFLLYTHIWCIYIVYKDLALTRTGHIQESICIIRLLALFHPRFRIVPARLTLKEFLHLRFAHWPAVFNGYHVRRFTLTLV